jgi:DNA-binding MarR family transcriptional regulator
MAEDAVAPPDNSGGDLEQFMRTMFTSIIVGLSRSLKQYQLTVSELAALHLIDRHGALRVGEVASLLDITLPAASRVAAVLVDQELVTRQEDPADRRARTLTLSDAGRALIERTSRERVETAFATADEHPGPVMERIAAVLASLGDNAKEGKS